MPFACSPSDVRRKPMKQYPSAHLPDSHDHPFQQALGWALILLALPLYWWLSRPGLHPFADSRQYLVLHTALELASVVAAGLVFITGYRAILSVRKEAVVLLGIAFLGVGLLDFLHAISHEGMPAADPVNPEHKAMLFWLTARLLAAVALFLYAILPAVPRIATVYKPLALAGMLLLVGAWSYVGLTAPQSLLPLLAGVGPAALAINTLTLLVLWVRREDLANECVMALGFAVALSTVSDVFVVFMGAHDKNAVNFVSYAYKLCAYLFLFHATFNEALRRPLQRMEIQHRREKLVLNAAPDGVLWVDESGRILMANPAMQALSGYPVEELIGRNVDMFLPVHVRARHADAMRGFFKSQSARAMGAVELKLCRSDGQMLPVDISLGYWEDENQRHAIAYIRDLSERKEFEETLRHRATHDQLTGLPNRWLFNLQLKQALAHAKRSGRRVAALFLDLDDFKTVNDSFGHGMGDELLVQVGERLRGALRDNDTLARLGGDEFAILLSDMGTVDEAMNVAEKLLQALDVPYRLENQDIRASGSIGLAIYPDDALDSESLLRYADLAMYQAKRAGRGTFACYSTQLDRHAHENMQLQARMKDALVSGGFRLLYQPQVDVASGAIVGAEALLRWHDADLGEIAPKRFIAVAEMTGLILPLSDWVLDTACCQIAQWEQAGLPMRVAVNFSAQQFRQRNLLAKIEAMLQRTGASARYLEIEITESIAMEQPLQAREQLAALVELGCSVSLDDFGTGYSSLAYLKALPVSKLKIDRGFVKDIPHDLSDVKISKSIIALAHSLDLTLVAEGVESVAQLDFLRDHGCESYQGWLFAKAMEAQDLTRLLEEAHRRS
jgi:diguanylate cyclase (GGDEF)-like protein/PAS domain S-box-containing protein